MVLRCQQDIDPQGTLGVGMDGIMRRSFLSKVQQGKTLWLAVHLVGPVKESLAFSEKRPVRNALSKFTPPLAAPAKTLKSEGIRMKGTALVFQMFGADFECLSPSSRTHRTCQVKKTRKGQAELQRRLKPHGSHVCSSTVMCRFLKSNGLSC